MAFTVEDLVNQALRRISFPTPIGYIYEGSKASRIAVDVFAQTRDNLLCAKDWDFARQGIVLTLLKVAPVGGYGLTPWSSIYPPVPWIYEYDYPATAMAVRSVRPTPILIPEYDPQPNVFVAANDTALGQKVLLTNLANATAVITAQITDINQWQDSEFVEAFVDALAVQFQQALAGDPNLVKLRIGQEQMAEAAADSRHG